MLREILARAAPAIVPPQRSRYLAEIADTVRGYKQQAVEHSRLAREIQQLRETMRMLHENDPTKNGARGTVEGLAVEREARLPAPAKKLAA